jgi:hypothetical protein
LESLGSFSSSNSVTAFVQGAIVNQETTISGDEGFMCSSSNSKENSMTVVGGFSGNEGNLNAQLTSVAYDMALTTGKVSILGINCFDEDISPNIASGDIFMKINGLYAQHNGNLGNFGLLVAINEEGIYSPESQISYQTWNDPNSYKLTGWRWVDNPSIELYLKTDSNLKNTGLAIDQVNTAIYNAADTWDSVTTQELFRNGLICSPSLSADKFDNENVLAWEYISSNALAYTRTYYSSEIVNGYNGGSYSNALESDFVFNTQYAWKTEAYPLFTGVYDVQTVALHELGHTLGLSDIYNTEYSLDTAEIMNSYNDPQRGLGFGDINGIMQLYGP